MKELHSNVGGKTVWLDPKDIVSMEKYTRQVFKGREPTLFMAGLEGKVIEAFTKVTLRNRQVFHILETPEEIMKVVS